MGSRTVTECDGCGGIPVSSEYPWIHVAHGNRNATCCSVYCVNDVLRRWDAPVASLNFRSEGEETVFDWLDRLGGWLSKVSKEARESRQAQKQSGHQ